jgi:CheY-like chemotaxis protein
MVAESMDQDAARIRVLLAEDDEDHVLLLQRALRNYPRKVEVMVARDGQETLDLLAEADPLPDLILLDINMPRLTGLEVLYRVKSDPRLRDIPTVMLTTSAREEDRAASFAGGADDFLTKPVNFRQFAASLTELLDRYFGK